MIGQIEAQISWNEFNGQGVSLSASTSMSTRIEDMRVSQE